MLAAVRVLPAKPSRLAAFTCFSEAFNSKPKRIERSILHSLQKNSTKTTKSWCYYTQCNLEKAEFLEFRFFLLFYFSQQALISNPLNSMYSALAIRLARYFGNLVPVVAS